jgi:hypothetical protein
MYHYTAQFRFSIVATEGCLETETLVHISSNGIPAIDTRSHILCIAD